MVVSPISVVVADGDDGTRYWKANWQVTAADLFGIWGQTLYDLLKDYVVSVDKIVIDANITNDESVFCAFYNGVTTDGYYPTEEIDMAAGLGTYTIYGPIRPLLLKSIQHAMIVWSYTTLTAGDALAVIAYGSAKPRHLGNIVPASQRVLVDGYVSPLQRVKREL